MYKSRAILLLKMNHDIFYIDGLTFRLCLGKYVLWSKESNPM